MSPACALPLVHLVGRQDHGKTTLVEQLVQALRRQGVTVGTVKHTSHDHELDTPRKDSHRHRLAGADPAAIVTPGLVGVYRRRDPSTAIYERLADQYRACDIVLVEGDLAGPGPKVEVWRAAVGTEPIAREHPGAVAAVISADHQALGAVGVPVWSPRPIARLGRRLLGLAATAGRAC